MSLKSLIGIIDYGMGNIKSVEKAIKFLGFESRIVNSESDFDGCSHLILPGVGSFGEAVKNLKSKGLFTALQKTEKPLLGICLGMQLLAESSEESPGVEGLGLVALKVTKLPKQHVGWEYYQGRSYYFVHGYAILDDEGKYVAELKAEHVTGVQFHPEKSQKAGLEYLRRWICGE